MKAKQLKEILSFIDNEEELFIDMGDNITNLAAISYNKIVCFTSHNYNMDDDRLTTESILRYIMKNH